MIAEKEMNTIKEMDTVELEQIIQMLTMNFTKENLTIQKCIAALEEIGKLKHHLAVKEELLKKNINFLKYKTGDKHSYSLSLSVKESEVLHILLMGLSDKEIAERMSISVNTVKTHLRKIYAKLHVKNRTEAVSKTLSILNNA